MSKKSKAVKPTDVGAVRRQLEAKISQLANLAPGQKFQTPTDAEILKIPGSATALWDFASAWVRAGKHLQAA